MGYTPVNFSGVWKLLRFIGLRARTFAVWGRSLEGIEGIGVAGAFFRGFARDLRGDGAGVSRDCTRDGSMDLLICQYHN